VPTQRPPRQKPPRRGLLTPTLFLVITPEYKPQHSGGREETRSTGCPRPYGEAQVTAKPLAVIGALGRSVTAGVWATTTEDGKSFGGAGARVVDAISLSIPD